MTNTNCLLNGLSQGHDETLLNILFWNAGGLTPDKFTEMKVIVEREGADVYGIVEAGAASESIEFFQTAGYQTYSLPRSRSHSSGIIVAAKKSIVVNVCIRKTMETNDKLEAMELELWKNGRHLRIIFVYNPPRNRPKLDWLDAIWDENCVLCGDLNAHSTRWGYALTEGAGQILEEFIDSNPVDYVENNSNLPTFMSYSGGFSHPDIVLAHPRLTPSLNIELLFAPGGIGHKIMAINFIKPSRSNSQCKRKRTQWNLRKANWKLYDKLTEEFLIKYKFEGNVDRDLKNIQNFILKSAKKSIPRGRIKKYSPFWNTELQVLKEERDQLRAIVEEKHNPQDISALKQKSATMKKKVLESKKSSYRTFLQKLDYRRDGVKAHKFLSGINNDRATKNNPIQEGENILTDEREIAKLFCKHYCAVSNFQPNKKNKKPQTQLPVTCLNEGVGKLFNSKFGMEELDLAIKGTKKGKSAGPDELMPEFIINLGEKSKIVVLELLNQIWCTHLPSEWKKGEVVPVPKKGKTSNKVENYRPITLTSVFCKVLERMVLRRLQVYLEGNRLLSNKQAAFKKNRGTFEQVIRLSQEIKDGYHRKQHTLAVFVDFKTAFDRVWRKRLLHKLIDLGVHGNMYKVLASFLDQRLIRVRYNSSTSFFKQTRQGLPQGSVLSPTLFSIMIDDIVHHMEALHGTNTLLYADDLVIWATSGNVRALESHLNLALQKLQQWAEVNEMVINTRKTECQLFSLSTKTHEFELKYAGEVLKQTDSATYLGITLDKRLNWGKHAENVSTKGEKRLGLMKRITGTKWGATQDLLTLAYKSYVRPVLEYGNELLITAPETVQQKIERTQNKALRIATGAPKSTPITAMQLQTGIEPTMHRSKLAAVYMEEKILRLENSYWENYNKATTRLKSQVTFSQKLAETREENGQINAPRQKLSAIPPRIPTRRAMYKLKLLQDVKKQSTTELELKACALEVINECYPSPPWLHVYTDGSAEGAARNGGAGIFATSFEISEAVGGNATNFDAEIFAILLALKKLLERSDAKVVLFVDSQSAIIAVAGAEAARSSSEIAHCRELIEALLLRGTELVFQWVPSHCGLYGNDKADLLAKEGSQMVQPTTAISFTSAKRIAKVSAAHLLKEKFLEKARGKKWESLLEGKGRIPADRPRHEAVALFRMKTGHDYLQSHLHRIGVVDSPVCPLCGDGIMDADHLWTCNYLRDVRQASTAEANTYNLYWVARRRMAEVAEARIGIG